MELDDGAFPLLQGVVATTDPVTAFRGVDAIVMVGAFPRKKGRYSFLLVLINARNGEKRLVAEECCHLQRARCLDRTIRFQIC